MKFCLEIQRKSGEATMFLESAFFETQLGQFWGYSGSWVHLFSPWITDSDMRFYKFLAVSKNWQVYGKVNNSASKICLCLQTTKMKKDALLLLWLFLGVLKMQTQNWHRKSAKDFGP